MQSHEEPYLLPDEEPILSETESEGRMQILVAASIGLFCLISLLILRNMTQWNTDLYGWFTKSVIWVIVSGHSAVI